MKKKSVNVLKKVTSNTLAFVMAFSMLSGVIGGITAKAETYNVSNPRIEEDGTVTWDKVQFGSYRQSNGGNREPIEWRVLSVDGDDALLLSDKIIDRKLYDDGKLENRETIEWSNCSLRTWLNKDFFEEAFNESERNAIMNTEVNCDAGIISYNYIDGENTNDKVFLLSDDEVHKSVYGFDIMLNSESETRKADYTELSGYGVDDNYKQWYWLRNQTGYIGIMEFYYNYCAAAVTDSGYVGTYAVDLDSNNFGIRPAIHIDLSKVNCTVSGSVSAKKTLDVDAVNTMISDIGEVKYVYQNVKIKYIRKVYNELSEEDKEKIETIDILEAAESKIEKINQEQESLNIEAATEVDELISAIGTVTVDSKNKIDSARKAYDKLSDGAKDKVTKLSVLEAAETKLAELEKQETNAASEVDKLITAIGTVSVDSKTAIETARKAYNELSEKSNGKMQTACIYVSNLKRMHVHYTQAAKNSFRKAYRG